MMTSPPDRANAFTGVKVFSATLAADRERLGDRVTAWLAQQRGVSVVDVIVTQSSDSSFHCVAITLFFTTAG